MLHNPTTKCNFANWWQYYPITKQFSWLYYYAFSNTVSNTKGQIATYWLKKGEKEQVYDGELNLVLEARTFYINLHQLKAG